MQIEESATQNSTLQCKVTQLESSLATREQEVLAYEVKYRKCVERAKEVIKNIDPRIANGLFKEFKCYLHILTIIISSYRSQCIGKERRCD